MAGDLVPVAYGGRPPADGARLAPLMSQGGEVGATMPTCAGRAVAPLEAHQPAKSRQSEA